MKHPDWHAFVAAIVSQPDDDTLRLVTADFLDENGEPARAAFIRIQVALARLEASGLAKSLEADELRKKERAVLGPLSPESYLWAAEECPELLHLPRFGHTTSALAHLRFEGTDRLTWRRGFVEAVRCPAAQWLRCGATVRKRNPVRAVTLLECDGLDRNAWYAGLPALSGLRTVTLSLPWHNATALDSWLETWLPGTEVVWAGL